MKKSKLLIVLFVISVLLVSLCACSSGEPSAKDLPTLRKLSWEGTELTVTVGTNKSTGCEWKASFEDSTIVDYSVNRKFHLIDNAEGKSIGYSEIGFTGKKAGTTTITLTTPCDWEGTGKGYTYVVTVTVGEGGTIQSAEGKDM